MRKILFIALACFLLAALWFSLRMEHTGPKEKEARSVAQAQNTSGAAPVPDTPTVEPDERLNRLADGQVEFLPALEASRRIRKSDTVTEGLHEIEALLGHYRFAYGENPVGVENFEITEQLLGKNPKRIVFIAPDSAALRGNELVDRWGTPFFFHAKSGTVMEIGSAGPDQTFWTGDDIFIPGPDRDVQQEVSD